MGKISLRRAQLVSPFGVGALCEVDGQSFFIKGTGRWPSGQNLTEIELPSLVSKLSGISALNKPEYLVAADRFPRWHFCPNCRAMLQWSFHLDKRDDEKDPLPTPRCKNSNCKGRQLVPMRFIAVCDHGHIDEIDWHGWAHRRANVAKTGQCDRKEAKLKFLVTGKSGGDFKSMLISCECGASSSLEGISDRALPQKCRGYFPGEGPSSCTAGGKNGGASPMWMEPRGSSALHYASVISALDIARAGTVGGLSAKLHKDRIFTRTVKMAKRQLKKGSLQVDDLEDFFDEDIAEFAPRFDATNEECWEIFLRAVVEEDSETEDGSGGEIDQGDILGNEFPVLASPSGFDGKTLKCVASATACNLWYRPTSRACCAGRET